MTLGFAMYSRQDLFVSNQTCKTYVYCYRLASTFAGVRRSICCIATLIVLVAKILIAPNAKILQRQNVRGII